MVALNWYCYILNLARSCVIYYLGVKKVLEFYFFHWKTAVYNCNKACIDLWIYWIMDQPMGGLTRGGVGPR